MDNHGSDSGVSMRALYVSIFYGSGNPNNAGNQALEIMKTNSSTSAYATLSTFLIDDAFIGQQITNALYNPHSRSDSTNPSVFVDYIGNVGIGTTYPACKLHVEGAIALRPQLMPYDIDRGTVSDISNREHTYIAFAPRQGGNDWAYLRYLGDTDSMSLALDFHDNGEDAGFVIRDIHSTQTPM